MRIKFRETTLNKKSLARLLQINTIIEEYQEQGYVLTLRQLYYQLVSRDIIPNKASEYGKLSTVLKEGRMAGLVDWNAIEDRLRKPSRPAAFDNPKDGMKALIDQYEIPRMEGQPVYLEVWVEKDALSGVLKRITRKYHINIMVNRGYSSTSAMYDAFMRFVSNGYKLGRPIKLLYLGDFDPSGLDMIHDIKQRISEFNRSGYLVDGELIFDIEAIALTKAQIDKYNPPPNPAKITDPRAKEFIKNHGNTSWEVDALTPSVLNNLLESSILAHINLERYEERLKQEWTDKKRLTELKRSLI